MNIIKKSEIEEFIDESYSFLDESARARLVFLYNAEPKSEEELKELLGSKFWRLNNLYSIVTKKGDLVRFKLNRAQLKVYGHSHQHNRLVILKSRQQGISTLWLYSFFDDALFSTNIKCGLMAQDSEAAEALLERIKFLWDNFSAYMKHILGVRIITNNRQKFELNNGSCIMVRTSFRSMTLQRLHISELGYIALKFPIKAKETNTGSLQTIGYKNPVIIESTATGQNMFYDKYMEGKTRLAKGELSHKDFYPIFLPWVFDKDCMSTVAEEYSDEDLRYFIELEEKYQISLKTPQKNFWVMQGRELGGDINQEYPGTDEQAFTAALDGSYWSKMFYKQIVKKGHLLGNEIYDPRLPVYVAQDLGRSDYYVLLFFQVYKDKVNIIKEYYNYGEDIHHYIQYLYTQAKEAGYKYERVIFPHDGGVTDLTSGNRTRESIFYDEGIRKTLILPKMDVSAGIEIVREVIPRMYINKSCTYLISCFERYTKAFNTQLNIWRDQPKEDMYSHGADTIRYMSVYINKYLDNSDNTDVSGYNEPSRIVPSSGFDIAL